MRPERAADHSPPSSAAVMKRGTSIHPLGHTGPVTGSLYFTVCDVTACDLVNRYKYNF